MLFLVILIMAPMFSFGAVLESVETTGDKSKLQGASFGYEILEHRLDDMQNTIFKLFASMEKAEQTRLESQRMMLERANQIEQVKLESQRLLLDQIQKGITVYTINRRINQIIEDCMEADISGRYLLRPAGVSKAFPVICETESFGGGWLVLQQRINGTVDFNRNWESYKNGFGIIGKFNEFWLGLERMHQITKNQLYELVFELRNESGVYGFALHSKFSIAGEDDNYRLFKEFRKIEGTVPYGMAVSTNEQFSTYDKDNDDSSENCGSKYKSGWWFYQCKYTNLNGPYKKDPETGRGIYKYGWTDAATYSRIMIRRT